MAVNKTVATAGAVILTVSLLAQPSAAIAQDFSSVTSSSHTQIVEMDQFYAAKSGQFKDVASTHWAATAINAAVSKGYFKGYADGTFKPDAPVTREEFAVLLDRVSKNELTGSPVTLPGTEGKWSQEGVSNAVRKGFLGSSEYKAGFKPVQAMTRIEMAQWVVAGLTQSNQDYAQAAKESMNTILPVAEYYKGGLAKSEYGVVAVAMGTGLFTGFPDGRFGGSATTSRAEVAAILLRLESVQTKAPSSFNELQQMREVSLTGTNAVSYGFEYTNGAQPLNKFAGKSVTLGNGKATMEVKHLIVVDPTKKDSLYTKMFVGKNFSPRGITGGQVHLAFVDAIVTPKVKMSTAGLGKILPLSTSDGMGYSSGTEETYGVKPMVEGGGPAGGAVANASVLKLGQENEMWLLRTVAKSGGGSPATTGVDFNNGYFKVRSVSEQ